MRFRRDWWHMRDRFIVAFMLAMIVAAFSVNPRGFGGFGCGVSIGGLMNFLITRRMFKKIDQGLAQDLIDLRTTNDIVRNLNYDMMRHVEKSGMN